MKRAEVLGWVLLAIILSVGLIWWLNAKDIVKSQPLISINQNARLAASGSPLPATSSEDVLVQQQQLDGTIFSLNHDYETNNWQLDFWTEGRLQSLRYLDKAQQFFYFNPLDLVWDEVDPQLLHQDFKDLIEIEQFLFTNQQLDNFSRVATEQASEPCHQNPASVCAVWRAQGFSNFYEVLIYVNKQTRKINQIISFNSNDQTELPLIADYLYQDIDIQLPPANQVRYLKD